MNITNEMLTHKINLLVNNFEQTKKIGGAWGIGMMRYSIALSQALKDQTINPKEVEQNIQLIKDQTSWLSNFRGHSLYYLATLLSQKEEPEKELESILSIYDKLKANHFKRNNYLPFMAIIINESKDKLAIDVFIKKINIAYNFMTNHHPFLTSSDDYCRAALIAIHANNLDNDLAYIEDCYSYLNKHGFFKSNNLQALSHIMTFSSNKNEESMAKVVQMRDLLSYKDCKLDGYGYPLLGAITLIDADEEVIADQIKHVSDQLKEIRGFGAFTLGKSNRNMMSAALVASCYADMSTSELQSISNNIFVEIVIAIEIATTMAIIAASSAAASSGS